MAEDKKTSPKTTKTTNTESKKTQVKSQENKNQVTKKTEVKPKTTKPKTTKPKTTKPKTTNPQRVKKQEELTTLEVLEQAVEHKEITEKKPLGKTFYLLLGIVVYAIAFFYIYNVVYNNGDILQSAIFAFAAVFIMFVLMLFNVHMLVVNFFILPFRRLIKESRKEINKEIIYSIGKNKMQTAFNKYKSLFTLILYTIIAGLLIFASIRGSIEQGDKILQTVASALITLVLFLVVVCSWQYLFNIIPSLLEKSIDAKNGFILTLSAAVIVIYIVFLILDITYLAEIMIFVLIIGFIALLGVNLNMIVGEINIFQNLRGRKSKAVTRVVFIVFFGFHIYVILYASVVAYSIYNWEPESFVFSSYDTKTEVVTELYNWGNQPISQVYWNDGTGIVPLDNVYDINGNLITEFIDDEFIPVKDIYDQGGNFIFMTDENGQGMDFAVPPMEAGITSCETFYYDGVFACVLDMPQLHTYGDFLYWTVITVSTIGYGDVHPSTEYNIAMGWGGFLGLYGLTFFALSISFVSNIAMEGVNTVREESKKDD